MPKRITKCNIETVLRPFLASKVLKLLVSSQKTISTISKLVLRSHLGCFTFKYVVNYVGKINFFGFGLCLPKVGRPGEGLDLTQS